MLEVSADPAVPKTEARFEEVGRRMEADGLARRSKTSIKNMWCRVGRGRSGFDERKGVRRDARFAVNGWRAKEGNEGGRGRKKMGKWRGGKKVARDWERDGDEGDDEEHTMEVFEV